MHVTTQYHRTTHALRRGPTQSGTVYRPSDQVLSPLDPSVAHQSPLLHLPGSEQEFLICLRLRTSAAL